MDSLMKRVHKVQLDMALEVKKICEKYDIKYFIIAGTLLGAVRHKGFIPWDDDLDIGMIREDYEKFIDVAKEELKEEYFLQTWDTDSNFGLPIAKLRKNGTKFIEENSSKTNSNNGIYIDIFPFDNVPMNTVRKKIHSNKIYVLKRIILIKLSYELWGKQDVLKKNIYKFLKLISKPLTLKSVKKLLYREMVKYNICKTDNVVAAGGAYGYCKESIKREWVDNLSNIIFEDYELACPKKHISYLKYFYGDYMKLPPEDKRYNRHNIINIEFEEDN